MIDSLNIASDGYLNKGLRKVLVIAVAGLLMFPVPVEPKKRPGGQGPPTSEETERGMVRAIKYEDEEILYILKIFLECQQ